MLQYLLRNARPDIKFAVNQVARHTHNPKLSHEIAIKRICRYLKGTRDEGLTFKPTDVLNMDCYVDADFAGLWNVENPQEALSVKSRTGFVITLAGCSQASTDGSTQHHRERVLGPILFDAAITPTQVIVRRCSTAPRQAFQGLQDQVYSI
jgi:hypothetical protein